MTARGRRETGQIERLGSAARAQELEQELHRARADQRRREAPHRLERLEQSAACGQRDERAAVAGRDDLALRMERVVERQDPVAARAEAIHRRVRGDGGIELDRAALELRAVEPLHGASPPGSARPGRAARSAAACARAGRCRFAAS